MNKIIIIICFFGSIYLYHIQKESVLQKYNKTKEDNSIEKQSIFSIDSQPSGVKISQQELSYNTNDLHPKVPQFKGGLDSLSNYIKSNLVYPILAKKDGIGGKVIVEFLIDNLGKVKEVSIVEGVREDLNIEALRVVTKMPDWIGCGFSVKYRLPINFNLDK
jgi:TonB family protein